MAFTDVFGGELIFPSQLSYLMITTAVDIELQWPTEQQITGDSVVADVMDVDTTVPSLNIDMPDARNASTGNKATFNNRGANSFTVRDNTGGTIQQVLSGEQWVVVLTDNSTQAGVWTTFQLGGNAATPASASGLAGAGLKAISALLNQKIDSDVEASTPVTVVDGDRAKCLVYTAGAGQADLPSAGTVGNDWFFMLRNSGSGTLAVTPPSGNIDGSSSINLDPNDSAFIFTDGADYFTIGLSTGSTIAFDFVSLPIPGSGDFVLSGANLNRISYRFTGALTGNRKVVVPDTTQQYWCDNQTTGAFVLSIATAGQAAPPTLDAGTTAIFYSDSSDVIDAVNAVSVSFPILVSQGGTSANNAPDALINLSALPIIVDLPSVAPALGDFLAFQDIDDVDNNKRATITDILALGSGAIAPGTVVSATLRWDGAAWIENTLVQTTALGVLLTNALDSLGASAINVGGMDESDPGLNLEDGMSLRFEDRAQTNDFFIQNQGVGALGPILYLDGPGTGIFTIGDGLGFRIEDAGNTDWLQMSHDGTHINMGGVNTDALRIEYPILMDEQAAAAADLAGYGQVWVRNDVPNVLMFTNDVGTDFVLGGGGAANKGQVSGSVALQTTGFVGVLNAGPSLNTDYMINVSFEVTAPAADDIKIQFAFNTLNNTFKGTIWNSNDNTVQALEATAADVITNIVVIPTTGAATPGGTYCSVQGVFRKGGDVGTLEFRAAKNADTGADGLFAFGSGMILLEIP